MYVFSYQFGSSGMSGRGKAINLRILDMLKHPSKMSTQQTQQSAHMCKRTGGMNEAQDKLPSRTCIITNDDLGGKNMGVK